VRVVGRIAPAGSGVQRVNVFDSFGRFGRGQVRADDRCALQRLKGAGPDLLVMDKDRRAVDIAGPA
jgi:hypothetical protein